MRILCVCRGNTCRSPMAEGALRARLLRAGLTHEVDSAGVAVEQPGQPPDPRGLAAASARGYDNSALRARQVHQDDFTRCDLMLAMDAGNLAQLRLACPVESPPEIRLFHPAGIDIADPFHGGPEDYERALDMIEEAADHLIGNL